MFYQGTRVTRVSRVSWETRVIQDPRARLATLAYGVPPAGPAHREIQDLLEPRVTRGQADPRGPRVHRDLRDRRVGH